MLEKEPGLSTGIGTYQYHIQIQIVNRPSGSEAVLRGKVGLGAIWYHGFSENTDFDFSSNIKW